MLSVGAAGAASSILIWPVDPVIADGQQGTALWLENKGDSPVNLQVRVLSWEQREFDDQYQSQRDVIGIPQVALVAPGQKQLVRLTRLAPTPAGQQQAYRVVIDEIPGAQTQESGTEASAVRFNMRYLIPLFAYGAGMASVQEGGQGARATAGPRLAVQAVREDGRVYLQMRNDGPVHARLTEAALESAGKRHVLSEGLMGYVLPGATMRWPLSIHAGQGDVLVVRVNGGAQPQRLTIE